MEFQYPLDTNCKKIAKENDICKDQLLAQQLWATEIHELRIRASLADDPIPCERKSNGRWIDRFNSWDSVLYERSFSCL